MRGAVQGPADLGPPARCQQPRQVPGLAHLLPQLDRIVRRGRQRVRGVDAGPLQDPGRPLRALAEPAQDQPEVGRGHREGVDRALGGHGGAK